MRAALAVALASLVLATGPVARAYPRPSAAELISVDVDGDPAPSATSPSISDDGRCVAFSTFDGEIFLRDRDARTTTPVSVSSEGARADGRSSDPEISANCTKVAFQSAPNLVSGDTNGAVDVFVRDLRSGRTERVSLGRNGGETNRGGDRPAISSDGRFVAFSSASVNVVAGDENVAGITQVYLRDLMRGTTERVSSAAGGGPGNLSSTGAAVSFDGRFIAFESVATDLDATPDAPFADVFVRDRLTRRTTEVSLAPDGSLETEPSLAPSIGRDGRYVAFTSAASNLVPDDGNFAADLFVHDRGTGVGERVSVGNAGEQGDDVGPGSAISADGRFVTFASTYTPQLGPGVVVYDRRLGLPTAIAASDPVAGDVPDITPDGRTVVANDTARDGLYAFAYGPSIGAEIDFLGSEEDSLIVTGRAMFAGVEITSGGRLKYGEIDEQIANALGADVLSGTLTYRAEEEDLLARWHLKSVPGAGTSSASAVSGNSAIVYRLRFTVAASVYEVRAESYDAWRVQIGHAAALYRCAPECAYLRRLGVGIGTTGNEVRVAIPLEAIGAREGSALTDVSVASGIGDQETGIVGPAIDESPLPDAVIPARTLAFGIAAAGEPALFDVPAMPGNGHFVQRIPSPPGSGAYVLWVRACLGNVCGTDAAPFSVS